MEEPKKPEGEAKPETAPTLKACPSCGGEAHIYRDRAKVIRCACKVCGFWDAAGFPSELAAAQSWNAAGGPNKE